MLVSKLRCMVMATLATSASLAPARGHEPPDPTLGGAPYELQMHKFSDYGPQYRDFLFTDSQMPRLDYLGVEDIETSLVGSRLYLAHDHNFALMDLNTPAKEWRSLAKPIPAVKFGPYFGGLKYRDGHFFMKENNKVFKYDSHRKQWDVYFTTRMRFSQFEILPDDRVAIICPARPPVDPLPDSMVFMERAASMDNDKIPLMEIYSRKRPKKPLKVIPFPAAMADTLLLVNAYPLVDKTVQVNGQFLLVSSQAGQVFLYDSKDHSLHGLEVPWPSLTSDHLKNLDKLGLKPANKNGVIKLSQRSFPVKIQLYPQGSREILFEVVLNSVCEPGYSRLRDVHEMANGNRFAPVTKEYTAAENADWSWMKYYRFDLSTRRFEELKTPKLTGLRLDFGEHWLTLSGETVPLKALGLGGTDPGQTPLDSNSANP